MPCRTPDILPTDTVDPWPGQSDGCSTPHRRAVTPDEAGTRLDRWLTRHYPGLPHSRIRTLLRRGWIRIDGGRCKASHRLAGGENVDLPPLHPPVKSRYSPDTRMPRSRSSRRDLDRLRQSILYEDDDIWAFNKACGLAVQGGSGITCSVDAMLVDMVARGDMPQGIIGNDTPQGMPQNIIGNDTPQGMPQNISGNDTPQGMPEGVIGSGQNEKPRLVHRLDRRTSGVLIVARTIFAASRLADAFRRHRIGKTYWALTKGIVDPPRGRCCLPIVRTRRMRSGQHYMAVADGHDPFARSGKAQESMEVENAGVADIGRHENTQRDGTGKTAKSDPLPCATLYATVARHRHYAWMALSPLSGRTHQLRVHLAAMGAPICGDDRYGDHPGSDRYLAQTDHHTAKSLYLHAHRIDMIHPRSGKHLCIEAPLPDHMASAWDRFGFDLKRGASVRF